MDNHDLTVHIVETVVKELDAMPMQNRKRWWAEQDLDEGFIMLWDELRNPILNILENERPEHNQHMGAMRLARPDIPRPR